MKKILIALVVVAGLFGSIAANNTAEAASRVKGYYKPSTGRYVMPHYKSSPNKSKFDNYSTKGNYNPYTGKKGYKSPYRW